MSNIPFRVRVERILAAEGIFWIAPQPVKNNWTLTYRFGQGNIVFNLDGSGYWISLRGVDYQSGVPAELGLFVSGLVDAPTQRRYLHETLGPERTYPSQFETVIQYLKKYSNLETITQRFGEIEYEEAMRRLVAYRTTYDDSW